MTKTYFPFDAGPGSSVNEGQWAKMAAAWSKSGVSRTELNKLEPFGDSSGMQIKVKSGQAMVGGFFFESDAEEIVTIPAANPTNPRYDIVVLRLDRSANSIDFAVVQGTPAADPVFPDLVRTSLIYELPIARVTVAALASTIAAGDVSDFRIMLFLDEDPFGSGMDGDVIINSTITLTRDMEYNTLRIDSGGILKPAGFTIKVRSWLWMRTGGKISRAGNPGGNSSGGTGGSAGGQTDTGPMNGVGGSSGVSTSGAVSGAHPPTAPKEAFEGNFMSIGAGNGGCGGGGTGQTNTGGGGAPLVRLGTKGGAGGTPTASATVNGGGGGGGGGGSFLIFANWYHGQGTLEAKGGDGGAGGATSGGGGGGSGGFILLKIRVFIAYGSLAYGGGSGGGGGFPGSAGGSGFIYKITVPT